MHYKARAQLVAVAIMGLTDCPAKNVLLKTVLAD